MQILWSEWVMISLDACTRSLPSTTMRVTVVGAAGGIGQPLSLLIKQNPLVSALSLYDVSPPPPSEPRLSSVLYSLISSLSLSLSRSRSLSWQLTCQHPATAPTSRWHQLLELLPMCHTSTRHLPSLGTLEMRWEKLSRCVTV
jgi:hypothetical protein